MVGERSDRKKLRKLFIFSAGDRSGDGWTISGLTCYGPEWQQITGGWRGTRRDGGTLRSWLRSPSGCTTDCSFIAVFLSLLRFGVFWYLDVSLASAIGLAVLLQTLYFYCSNNCLARISGSGTSLNLRTLTKYFTRHTATIQAKQIIIYRCICFV